MSESSYLNKEAERLGKIHKNFWRDFHAWDNSGWLGEGDNDAWGDWCKERYYSGMQTVISRYHRREKRKANKVNLPCQHYLKGKCKFGDNCKYVHVDAQPKQQICRNYVRNNGYCSYGKSCNFVHVLKLESPLNLNRMETTKLIYNSYIKDMTYEDYLKNGWMSTRDYFKMYLEEPGKFIRRFETSQLDQVKNFTLNDYDSTIYPESDDEDD
jgi:hypothetical protein